MRIKRQEKTTSRHVLKAIKSGSLEVSFQSVRQFSFFSGEAYRVTKKTKPQLFSCDICAIVQNSLTEMKESSSAYEFEMQKHWTKNEVFH